jgi:uncharacterized RDD family membrane protein YckC
VTAAPEPDAGPGLDAGPEPDAGPGLRAGPEPYAGIVSRGIAFSVDAVIALVVATGGYQVAVAVLATIGVTTMWRGDGATALGYVLAVPVVFFFYCAGFWTLLGRTPGMMLLGVRVVTAGGTPPGARRSVIRALGYWVSAILLLGFVWIAVDRRSQGFHDKLAGTFVVYDWGDGAGSVRS